MDGTPGGRRSRMAQDPLLEMPTAEVWIKEEKLVINTDYKEYP